MTLYLGEAVRILAVPTDPETGLPLNPPPTGATVDFWAPGLDRKVDAPTISAVPMTFRSATGDFILFQDTAGANWVLGKWVYRVTVQGATFRNFEYASFSLKA